MARAGSEVVIGEMEIEGVGDRDAEQVHAR
jgi:hypothetical protein